MQKALHRYLMTIFNLKKSEIKVICVADAVAVFITF